MNVIRPNRGDIQCLLFRTVGKWCVVWIATTQNSFLQILLSRCPVHCQHVCLQWPGLPILRRGKPVAPVSVCFLITVVAGFCIWIFSSLLKVVYSFVWMDTGKRVHKCVLWMNWFFCNFFLFFKSRENGVGNRQTRGIFNGCARASHDDDDNQSNPVRFPLPLTSVFYFTRHQFLSSDFEDVRCC